MSSEQLDEVLARVSLLTAHRSPFTQFTQK
jgi:hypothetical protein